MGGVKGFLSIVVVVKNPFSVSRESFCLRKYSIQGVDFANILLKDFTRAAVDAINISGLLV